MRIYDTESKAAGSRRFPAVFRFLLGAAAFCCLLFIGPARAENGYPVPLESLLAEDRLLQGESLTIDYTLTGNLTTGSRIEITADVSGDRDDYEYTFTFWTDDPYSGSYVYALYSESTPGAADSWSFQVFSPGDYFVNIDVYADGVQVGHLMDHDHPITVTGTDYVEEKAWELAQEFATLPGDDFDRVLAVHDWLTSHADYDYSLRMHHPQGVLLQGSGVCESYARAFQLILEYMGIPTCYLSGYTPDGDHAWNVVQMDGKWYNIDTTWDDSGPLGYHVYFGLSDEYFSMEHTVDTDYAAQPFQCVSMEDNYYVRNDYVQKWIDEIREEINEAIHRKAESLDIAHSSILLEDGEYHNIEVAVLLSGRLMEKKLSQESWHYEYTETADGEAVTEEADYSIAAAYDAQNHLIHIDIGGIIPRPANVCRIPAGVSALESEGFRGTAFDEFILPDRPVAVGEYCFADLQKKAVKITIPNAGTVLSATAFAGNEQVTVCAPAGLTVTVGSAAVSIEDFCRSNGYIYMAY